MKYDFEFSWASTYGFAAKLVAQTCERGLVIDLGCGAGSFAAPLDELGFDYHGFEYDPESVELCRSRGIPCDPVDLTDIDATLERVTTAVDGRPVQAISLLDVIEHLVDPERVFENLRKLVAALTVDGQAPRVVVSIPNVAHADLAVKLVAGRWDVVDVGLLDDTHVTLFTEQRVRSTFDRHGFTEVAANDVVIPDTEQQYPTDHPAVARDTPLSSHLRSVRRRADNSGDTYQFVRCYELDPGSAPAATAAPTLAEQGATTGPLLSVAVVVRDGAGLGDLLTCLAAQHDRDLEVLIAPISQAVDVDALVAGFGDAFTAGIRVLPTASSLAAAGNAVIESAEGQHVAFLDEATVLTGRWTESVRASVTNFPGRTVRSAAVTQRASVEEGRVTPLDGFAPDPNVTGDEFINLLGGRAPRLDGLVVPMAALRGLGHRFDPSLDADAAIWAFVLRLVADTGLVRTDHADLVRRHPRADLNAAATQAAWAEVAATFDERPLLLPAGVISLIGEIHELRHDRDEAAERAGALAARVDAMERSRYWTATAPLRRVAAAVRSRRTRGDR